MVGYTAGRSCGGLGVGARGGPRKHSGVQEKEHERNQTVDAGGRAWKGQTPLSPEALDMYLGPGNHAFRLGGVLLTHLRGGLAVLVKNKSDDFPNQKAKQEGPACPLPWESSNSLSAVRDEPTPTPTPLVRKMSPGNWGVPPSGISGRDGSFHREYLDGTRPGILVRSVASPGEPAQVRSTCCLLCSQPGDDTVGPRVEGKRNPP